MGEVKAGDVAERLETLQGALERAGYDPCYLREAASLLRSQAEEIARLRGALEPFAADFDWIDEPTRCPDEASVCADDYTRPITYADIRRARTALNRSGEP